MTVEFTLAKGKKVRVLVDDNPAETQSILLEIEDGQRKEVLRFPPRIAGVLGKALVMLAEGR